MESFSRTLTQERAILIARQGDPNSPAPGTLLARQKILHAELEASHARAASSVNQGAVAVAATFAANRQPDQVRRDLRRVERELIALQSRLREIDQTMAEDAEKRAK